MLFCSVAYSQRLHLRVMVKERTDSIPIEQPQLKNSFSNYKRLNQYADSIFKTIQRTGYLAATFTLDRKNDSVYEQLIRKQHAQRFINITVPDPSVLDDTRLGSSLSRKRNILTLPTQSIDSVLATTHQELLDAGQLFNRITLKDIVTTQADTLAATLQISLSTKRNLDRIVIKGYDDFPQNIAKNLIPRKSLVNKTTLSTLQTNLDAIPFTSQTKAPEFLFKKDSTLLYIYLRKINNNSAEGFLGFNNTDGQTNLTGNVDLRLVNNLNKGEELSIIYRADDNKQRLIESTARIPYIYNTRLGVTATLHLLRRDTIYQNNHFKAGVFFKPKWNSSLGVHFVNRNSVSTTTNNTDVQDLSTTGVEMYYDYQRDTQNKLQPINMALHLKLGYAQRRLENSTRTPQYTIGVQGSKLWNVLPKTAMYVQGNTRFLLSKGIQFNELYQLGGDQSMRGFRENSIDTNAYATLQTEVRYTLGSNFYTYSIADIGQFQDFNDKNAVNLYTIGGGIAILTQTGILRLSIANGSFNDLNLQYNNLIAHIKFTVLF